MHNHNASAFGHTRYIATVQTRKTVEFGQVEYTCLLKFISSRKYPRKLSPTPSLPHRSVFQTRVRARAWTGCLRSGAETETANPPFDPAYPQSPRLHF